MKYLIDAYNLIGHCQHICLSQKNKEECLVNYIKNLNFKSKDTIELIFDGKNLSTSWQSRYQSSHVTCIFTDSSQSADDYIKNKISKQKTMLTLVTSDKEIIYTCKKYSYCKILKSQEFLKTFTTTKNNNPNSHMQKLEIDYWLNQMQKKDSQ